MSKKWRLLGSGVLLAGLAWRMDWGQAIAAFGSLNGWLWLLALGLYLLTQVVSSLRWQLFARGLGLPGSMREYLTFYFVGMFFNLVLPTSVGGDVVRAWYLARRPPVLPGQRMAAFLSVLADRVSGVAVLAAVAVVAMLCCPIALPNWIVGAVAAVGTAAVVGVIGLPALNWILRSPRLTSPRLDRLRRLAEGGMTYLRRGRLMAGTTVLSLVVQVNNCVVVGLIGVALGLPIPPLYYGVLMPLVTLLTLLPVSVNGMGLREASTVLLLAPLGIGTAEAVTLAFLAFAAHTIAGLSGVVFYWAGGLPRLAEMQSADGETPHANDGADPPRRAVA